MASVPGRDGPEEGEVLSERIGKASFDEWYRLNRIEKNVREGTPFFNTPSPVPEPGRITPSQLLTCHRQVYYKHHNAPKETPEPRGVYWAGSTLETEVVVPYLESVTNSDAYIQNSIWMETSVNTDAGELIIKGETDPAFVRADGTPLLVTEIKTTANLDPIQAPRRRHLAQLHAYLHGLSSEWSRNIDGVIIYLERDSFDLKSFDVEFDQSFWDESVVKWGSKYLAYRWQEQLPPADPVNEWECEYCDYQHRCGQTDLPHEDEQPAGLLPLFDYPKEAALDHLRAHKDEKLTPTVAHRHRALEQSFDVYDWACNRCGARYAWKTVDWDGQYRDPPSCPTCSTELNVPIPLKPPSLANDGN